MPPAGQCFYLPWETSQYLVNRLVQHLVQAFMPPRKWVKMTLVIPWPFLCHHQWFASGSTGHVSKMLDGWIGTLNHTPPRINWIFHILPSSGQNVKIPNIDHNVSMPRVVLSFKQKQHHRPTSNMTLSVVWYIIFLYPSFSLKMLIVNFKLCNFQNVFFVWQMQEM